MLKIIRIILILVALGLVFWVGAITNPVSAYAPWVTVPESLLGDPLRSFAYTQVAQTFGVEEWEAFNKIVIKESNWRVYGSHYPTGYTKDGVKSSASGLCGFLLSTYKSTGFEYTEDPYVQIKACIVYIENRYKNPSTALKFHTENNWY